MQVSKTLTTLMLALGGFAIFCATLYIAIFFIMPPAADTAHDDVLPPARDIIDYTYQGNTVQYAYLSDTLPEKLAPEEQVSERTPNSYARIITQTKDETTYERIIYPQVQFAQDPTGTWRSVEYATATTAAFDTHLNHGGLIARLSRLIINTAHADTATIYAGSGDGYVVTTNSNWNTAHDATSGTARPADPIMYVESGNGFAGYVIYRAFLPFDTSSIPSAAEIQSAFLSVRTNGTAISNGDNDGDDFLVVVQTDQGTHTTLANADYNNAGAVNNPTEGSERIDLTTMTSNTRYSWTLDSAGRSWIKKSGEASNCSATAGITCLGMREGHDVLDHPISGSYVYNYAIFSTSEESGTASDPYLSVTYTEASFAPWMFSDF